MLSQVFGKYQGVAHSLMRTIVGFMFFTHGAAKLFGWFGGFGEPNSTVEILSRFGVAGVLETFGGALIMFGLFTRPAAFIVSGEMAVAYFWLHAQRGLWPWVNGGERPVLYSFMFLFLATAGSGPWGLDALLKRRQEEDK
ncbi:MAG: DoxX family protein [Gemmatimonadales bacterium]